MNKFKLYMLGLGLASMGLASCTAGFLDVESKTESTTDNFYRTESDAWRALIGSENIMCIRRSNRSCILVIVYILITNLSPADT